MAKKRVYEYAKELDVPTKSVIDKAKELGIDYNSHMSAMDDKQVEKLNTIFVSNNKSNAVSKNNDPKKATSTSSTKNQKGGNPITNQKNQSNQSQPNRPASKETDAVTSKPKNTTTVKPASTSKPAAKPAASTKPKTQTSSQTAQSGTGNQAPQRAAAAPAGNKNKRTGNRPFNRGSVGTHGGFNKRKRKGKKGETKPVAPPVARKFKELPEVLVYTDGMTVADISKKIYREPAEIIKKLFMLGVVATLNQSLGKEAIELLAEEYGIATEEKVQVDVSDLDVYFEQESAEENLTTRPPVVTIMGHVDHGKTTLLDSLRNTKVSLGEAGGITQHIGAYQVDVDGKVITFLDTPGHAAFTTMRARGADVTDITIIVVAADDGVMPQTVEAINHAKAAEVPIIVAVNKVDKPDANPERVMQELTEYGLVPESWGGDTIFVEISAKFGQNLDELLEMILLVAEVEDLKADPKRLALGSVIEARLDKSKGPIATLLVQEGTLNVGDPIVVGNTYGRVRVMVNENGRRVKHAGPSAPVEITGLNTAPQAGDQFVVFEDEKQLVQQEKHVRKKRWLSNVQQRTV